MIATSYWIGVNTGVNYSVDEYNGAAAKLAGMLTSLMSDNKVLTQITHSAQITSALAEVEVSLETHENGLRELVGKAVLDITSPEKVQLDKGKLSKLIKAREEADLWPKMTITKKRVPNEPSRYED